VHINGQTRQVHCVLDALILPLVEGVVATVDSTSPVGSDIITFRVTPVDVAADPPSAVISFGMRRDGEGTFFETACPYINAFGSASAYDAWIAATPEAVTMILTPEEAFQFAGDLVGARRGPAA